MAENKPNPWKLSNLLLNENWSRENINNVTKDFLEFYRNENTAY